MNRMVGRVTALADRLGIVLVALDAGLHELRSNQLDDMPDRLQLAAQ